MSIQYTEEHEWVRTEGDIAVVGITHHAQDTLGDVVFVELPQVGKTYAAKDVAGVVESVKAAADVYMPVSGEIVEVHGTYDPESLTGATATKRVKGTIHWVSAAHAIDAELRLYDRLFLSDDPGGDGSDPLENLNPDSLERLTTAKLEPSLAAATPGTRFQFERQGYFCADPDTTTTAPVFNRTVTLKDSWARMQSRGAV